MRDNIILQEFLENVSLEGFEQVLDYTFSLEDHFDLSNRESICNIINKQSYYRTNGFQDLVNTSTQYFLENHSSFEEFVEELAQEDFVQPYVNTGLFNVIVATTVDNIAGLMDTYPISIEDYGIEDNLLYKQIQKLTISNEGLVNGATAKAISSITHTNPAKIVNAKSPVEVKPVVEKALDTAVKKKDWFLVRAIKSFWTRLVNAYKNVKGGLSYMFGGKVKRDAIKNAKDLELADKALEKTSRQLNKYKRANNLRKSEAKHYKKSLYNSYDENKKLYQKLHNMDKTNKDLKQANVKLNLLKNLREHEMQKHGIPVNVKLVKKNDIVKRHESSPIRDELRKIKRNNNINKQHEGYLRWKDLEKKGIIKKKPTYAPANPYTEAHRADKAIYHATYDSSINGSQRKIFENLVDTYMKSGRFVNNLAAENQARKTIEKWILSGKLKPNRLNVGKHHMEKVAPGVSDVNLKKEFNKTLKNKVTSERIKNNGGKVVKGNLDKIDLY